MSASVPRHEAPPINSRDDPDARASRSSRIPGLLIIGAGARGHAYSEALHSAGLGRAIVAVAEPREARRHSFHAKYILPHHSVKGNQEFESWQSWLEHELERRKTRVEGQRPDELRIDACIICTLDDTHAEIVTALAPLQIHMLCEKPLATSLSDCLKISRALLPNLSTSPATDASYPSLPSPRSTTSTAESDLRSPSVIFSTGHVLRYSPHHRLLFRLLFEQDIIGEIVSIEHTEPVGWWHFAHSYVRGKWRSESLTAPSLLTKCCHDIDLMLWFMCRPANGDLDQSPHEPALVSSQGSLSYFQQSRKPDLARDATNCYACDFEPQCMYSAKKIYVERHLKRGIARWPVNAVDSDIEDLASHGQDAEALSLLESRLKEDYGSKRAGIEIRSRPWYGRCVYESDNDVCDDQTVVILWDEKSAAKQSFRGQRGAKTATIHMIAHTAKQSQRRGHIYGTRGEIEYDGETIIVHDFPTQTSKTFSIGQDPQEGHGGGDAGLALAFYNAVQAVTSGEMSVQDAQNRYIGCTLHDIIQSHAMVFAAEEARRNKTVIPWPDWWRLQSHLVQTE